mmetsp:Transcript_11248/g.39888  ORF Transcript_11248/g.39888 Transcript_11248/m.39888 type:complete len:884 (+) Transcript_11248:92-2743(+)
MADRAVVARNFPQAWVAPAALGSLPQKVQSLLQRIGPIDGAPSISQGPGGGLQALAHFKSAEAARDAVTTLHGTDLRTAQEKRLANFEPPKESERFWLRIASEAGVMVPQAGAGSPQASQPLAAAGALAAQAPAEVTAPRRSRPIPTGIVVSPFPAEWAEGDVRTLTGPYGKVVKVRMQLLASGLKGAYIDYATEAEASAARTGLDGLSLMGNRLRTAQQEQLEAYRATQRFVVFVDELAPPSTRPRVEPRLDDCEVFVNELPRASRSEEAARAWLGAFGEVAELHFVLDAQLRATGKAYARFRHHPEAVAAVRSSEGSQQITWSESERALRGTKGPYGLDLIKRLVGEGRAHLQEVVSASGLSSLAIGGIGGSSTGSGTEAGHVHFVMRCEHPSQVEQVRGMLAAELAKAHDSYKREVHGSLVLRGFPASWSEKGLKFVFAPFGGLASVALEEDRASVEAGASRIAYVKLRNDGGMEKAVTNLHQTKVGDGDLVEECVVECQRWPARSWSDGCVRIGFFIDQLPMHRRPLESEPGPEDRELFVQNLPLADMNPQQLQEYFEGFGEVEDLHLIKATFTEELTGEGYVRFKNHRDAVRCIEALTPSSPQDADPSDLMGSWSESERILQRKGNCYRFNLITELVGMDGSGLAKLKQEAKLKGVWVLSESLQQKDRASPPLAARQLQFVGKVTEEANVKLFREQLERTLEDIHTKIADRLEKRKRKAAAAADGGGTPDNGAPRVAVAEASRVNGQPPQPAGSAWMAPPPGWGQPPPLGSAPPTGYWGGGWQAPGAGARRRGGGGRLGLRDGRPRRRSRRAQPEPSAEAPQWGGGRRQGEAPQAQAQRQGAQRGRGGRWRWPGLSQRAAGSVVVRCRTSPREASPGV